MIRLFLLWLLVLPVVGVVLYALLVVAGTASFFAKPVRRSREEVIEILERQLSEDPSRGEWDDFVCVEIADPELDAIRRQCQELDGRDWDDETPAPLSAGNADRLRSVADQLRPGSGAPRSEVETSRPRPTTGTIGTD